MAAVARHGYAIVVAVLGTGIVAVAAFLLVVAVPDVTRTATGPLPTPTPAPSASPLSPMALSPVGIEMAANADCAACHVTRSGTVGTRPIPLMAHPLWGWRDCTACHATGSLVATAPGHTSLHKDDCLICHQPPDDASPSAAPRPHHSYADKPCLSCHGKPGGAPLPSEMEGRNNCWICHAGKDSEELFAEAGASASPGSSTSPSAPAGSTPAP